MIPIENLTDVTLAIEDTEEDVADLACNTSLIVNLQVVALVLSGVGFCIWRFFRKRRITKEQVPLERLEKTWKRWGRYYRDEDKNDEDVDDQVKKAQDEQGLVEAEEEPDFMEEEPLKVRLELDTIGQR